VATINHHIQVHFARAEGWQEAHLPAPGGVVHTHELAIVVVCRDGYIAILEWQMLAAHAVTGTRMR
jgi:methionyl-tRNA formyltransferase